MIYVRTIQRKPYVTTSPRRMGKRKEMRGGHRVVYVDRSNAHLNLHQTQKSPEALTPPGLDNHVAGWTGIEPATSGVTGRREFGR